jgi:hypothetical protein
MDQASDGMEGNNASNIRALLSSVEENGGHLF